MFYLEFYAFAKDEFELCGNYIYYLSDVLKADGEKDMSAAIEKRSISSSPRIVT